MGPPFFFAAMPIRDIQQRLIEIVEPICEDAGYELVEVQYQREPHGWVVRVFIDTQAGRGLIGFSDCEQLSRELSAVLDVADPLDHAYSLEVSSPGVDRPLRKVSHFQRFIGERALVKLREKTDGRRKVEGKLVSADDQAIALSVDGQTFRTTPDNVLSAKLLPDWDRLLAERKARAGTQV